MSPMAILVNDYTQELEAVMQETIADPSTWIGENYMPINEVGSRTLRAVIEEGSGGMTREHVINTDPHLVQRPGRRVVEYRAGFYREKLDLDEDTILHLRDYGNSNLALRGVQNEIEAALLKARRRIQTRMEYERWNTIFTGIYTYLGLATDFGVPGGNRVTPTVPWATAATATPLKDIRTWVTETFRKYRIDEIVMNQKTANKMLATTEVSTLLSAVGGRQAELRNDPSALLNFSFPGAPPIRVYDEWYQTETLDGSDKDKLVLSAPVGFVPDDLLYFVHRPMGESVGDFVMTPNIQNGSVNALGSGVFVVIDDKTEDDPGNPRIEVIAGFNGGPRLRRPFDVLTGDVS